MPVSRIRKKKSKKNKPKGVKVDIKTPSIKEVLTRVDERGLLPVRVLCGNLADLFFNISPDFLKEFENEVYNGLSDKIVYSIQTEYIRDVAQLNNQQQIVLYENFNQYLWSMTYALLVLFDKGVHAPRLNGEFSGAFADTPEVAEAWDLFQAALYLKKGYNREIFYHLPNPELNNGEEYILKANAVYLAALNFILLHEFGHQYYGHYSYFEPGDQAKQDEHLADDFAINKISGHFNSNNGKTLKAGILVGTLSLLFLRKTLGGGASHPNLDVRLKVIIEKLELEELDNLWGVAGLAISLWSNEFGHDVQIPPVGETYKELFYEILEDLPRFQ